VAREHPDVHVLVHCAGTIAMDTVADAVLDDFDRQYRVNLRAPFVITQRLLPSIITCRGQVAFVNSTAGVRAGSGAAQYAATKHGLRALADSLREEVNVHGVRVMSMFIGRTASRMQAAVHAHEQRPYRPEALLQPDDVASMLVHALELPRTAEVTDVSLRPLLKSY
jgi:NADP-dependent 3-hydroxy acid dehydrogenase YdfG